MKSFNFILVLALAVTANHSAEAQRPRPHGFQGEKFEANKKFGLGLELGDVFGLTGKVFVSRDQAIDFGFGDLYHGYYVNGDPTGLHVYGDYLWHPLVLAKTEPFELPLYVGVGARFWNVDYACNGAGMCSSTDLFGIRVPVGITFDFNNVPLDIFVQLVPTLDFYSNYTRSVFLDIDFSLGVRYWF
jgi:hypothetical protein